MLRSPIQPRRAVGFAVATFVGTIAAVIGCGGSGTSSSAPLTGHPAVQAVAVASYQSEGAGIAYPFKALALTAPSGSALSNMVIARQAIMNATSAKKPLGNLTYEPHLNLYTGPAAINNLTLTEQYYVDSAGTQPAGTMTLTVPSLSNGYTYPATITGKVALTAGNIPCNGTINITFADNTGANTITGSLNLSKNGEVVTVNMALDDNQNVSGSITIVENGATISATNLSGNVSGDLSCNLAIAPYGWTGTGTLNLATGKYSINVSAGSNGTCTASVDANGNLVITYGNGQTTTLADPLSVSLLASGISGTTGSTGSTGSNATYNTPVLIGNSQTISLTSHSLTNGNVVYGLDANMNPEYWSNGMSAPVKLSRSSSNPIATISANASNQVVAGFQQGGYAYWSSNTAMEQDGTVGYGNPYITDGGVIYGNNLVVGNSVTESISYLTAPLGIQQNLTLPNGVADAYIRAVSSGGAILADEYLASGVGSSGSFPGPPVYWGSYSAVGGVISNPGSSTFSAVGVNDKGQIVAGTYLTYYFLSSPTAAAVSVPLAYVTSLANNGDVLGATAVGEAAHGAYWTKAGGAIDINTLLPSGSPVMVGLLQMNNNGYVIAESTGANDSNGNATTNYYLLVPKS